MDDPRSDACSACISRRAILRGGAAGAAGVLVAALPATLPLGCMAMSPPTAGPVAAGNVADVPVGTLQLVTGGAGSGSGNVNVILGRDTAGLYAMSRVCTHQGELVTIISVGGTPVLHCYGHGSEFNLNGAVTRGPAGSPLEHFQVDLDAADGSITIQAGMAVPADARTKVV